jgi:hypothetical protein
MDIQSAVHSADSGVWEDESAWKNQESRGSLLAPADSRGRNYVRSAIFLAATRPEHGGLPSDNTARASLRERPFSGPTETFRVRVHSSMYTFKAFPHFKLLMLYNRVQTTSSQNVRAHNMDKWEPQILGTGKGLALLLTLQDSVILRLLDSMLLCTMMFPSFISQKL